MGVATATAMFMRTMGASVGVAVFGAIFSANLAVDEQVSSQLRDPANIDALPDALQSLVRDAASTALHPVFLAGALTAVVGFVLSTRLREVPLRESAARSFGPEAEMAEAIPT
jgi:hypothetical protein